MNHSIKLSKSVEKFLLSCDKRLALDFYEKAKIIAENPYGAKQKMDCKPMV